MNKNMKHTWPLALPAPMPKSTSALAIYIAKDKDFPGVGTGLANRMADRFGRHLRDALIERDPGVIEVLGYEVAETTFAAFETKAQEVDLIDWLDRNGVIDVVGAHTAIRIARCWGGDNGLQSIIENPYLLTAFLPWNTVEKVANALHISAHDPRRSAAAVEAVLYSHLDANDTLVAQHDVELGVAKLLNSVTAPDGRGVIGSIDAAVKSGGACRLDNGLQPFGAAVMEETIAQQVATAIHSPIYHDLVMTRPVIDDLQEQIDVFQRSQLHALTNMQTEAIRTALTNRIMVLAGYAGSGKTTSLRGICDIAEAQGRQLHCLFRSIRPPIPTTCAHLFRTIRPPVMRCREAVDFAYQVWGVTSSILAMVFRMDAPSSSMR